MKSEAASLALRSCRLAHPYKISIFVLCHSTPTKSSKNSRTKRISHWSFSSSCRSKKAGTIDMSAYALSTMTTPHP